MRTGTYFELLHAIGVARVETQLFWLSPFYRLRAEAIGPHVSSGRDSALVYLLG